MVLATSRVNTCSEMGSLTPLHDDLVLHLLLCALHAFPLLFGVLRHILANAGDILDVFARDLLDFELLHIRGKVSRRQILFQGVAGAVLGLKISNLCPQRGVSTLRTALIHPHSFFLSEGMRVRSAWA